MPTRKQTCKRWTMDEIRVILEFYQSKGPGFCSEVLASMGYNRPGYSCEHKAHKIGLWYKGEPMGQFKKGHIPHGKGKKLSPEQYKTLSPTMFKKGHAPRNEVPIGHETIRNDGYCYVKVGERKWKFKHRLIWEHHNGPIPSGYILQFKDGNPLNFSLSNLELITRGQNLVQNRHGSGPKPFSMLTDRAAKEWLRKRGFKKKEIRQNPELLQMARTRLQLKQNLRHESER